LKDWFPFTDYDFYAYLTAGMLVIAAGDYTFGGAVLVDRTEWTVVQVVFWTAIAYVVGQLVASPSSALLEHLVTRRWLHPPIAIALGLKQRRWRERVLGWLFADREYAPLPAQVRKRLLDGAAASLNVSAEEMRDPEAVFSVAFGLARSNTDAAARMDQFRNLYGFSRNVSFAGLVAAGLLGAKLFLAHDNHRLWWLLLLALIVAVGMFGRFLKFYAAYSREVLGAYSAQLTKAKPSGGAE
jgi:hypothetical protein